MICRLPAEASNRMAIMETSFDKSILRYWKILNFCCYTKLIPFNWNPDSKRFSQVGKKNLLHAFLIKLHSIIMYSVTTFSFVRLCLHFGDSLEEFPLFQRVVNVSWLMASVVICTIFANNDILRDDIAQHANSILDKIVHTSG